MRVAHHVSIFVEAAKQNSGGRHGGYVLAAEFMTVEQQADKLTKTFAHGCEKLSIMIPTYNCARHLLKALSSVKDIGEDLLARAQIIVVDDCSTKDDPEEATREVWGARVQFVRHDSNLGPTANFNACLDLADREWVHLLHGDDYVLPGAYREFAECVLQYPEALAVFARSEIVRDNGELICQSGSLGPDERGRVNYRPLTWARNPIYPAGVLLSQRAIRSVGYFDCHFSHVQDWNLWWRLAKSGQAVYSSHCIAGYRESEASHSSTLRRSARNLQEGLEQVNRVVASVKEAGEWSAAEESAYYEGVFDIALHQCKTYIGDRKAFAANWRYFHKIPRTLRRKHSEMLADLQHTHWREVLRRLVGISKPTGA